MVSGAIPSSSTTRVLRTRIASGPAALRDTRSGFLKPLLGLLAAVVVLAAGNPSRAQPGSPTGGEPETESEPKTESETRQKQTLPVSEGESETEGETRQKQIVPPSEGEPKTESETQGKTEVVRSDTGGQAVGPGENAVEVEMAFTHDDEPLSSLLVFSPLLSGRYALPLFSLGLDWGFTVAAATPEQGDGQAAFGPGNPFLSALLRRGDERTRWVAGLGAAAPLAWVSTGADARLQRAAYNYAMGMRGLWDCWLWAPEHTSVAALFEIDHLTKWHLRLSGDAGAAVLIPVGDYDDDVDLFLQAAGGVGFVNGIASTGCHLRLVLMPTLSEDLVQTSIVPWFRVDPEGGFVAFSLLFNLDEPLGGGYGMQMYGLQLSGGLTF
jgi:hypothetical protein